MNTMSKLSAIALAFLLALASRPVAAAPVIGEPAFGDQASFPLPQAFLNLDADVDSISADEICQLTASNFDTLTHLSASHRSDINHAQFLEQVATVDELIAAMLGLPTSDEPSGDVMAAADVDALLASILGDPMAILDSTELSELADDEDDTNGGAEVGVDLASSFGSGGSAGGAWYGGSIAHMGGPTSNSDGHSNQPGNTNFSSHGKHGSSGGVIHSYVGGHHHYRSLHAVVPAGSSAVPLPAGVWAGLILIAGLAIAYRMRAGRWIGA
jgi:hypothetical protein